MLKSKGFLVAVTVFLLAAIPITTYVVIRSEQVSREPQASTACESDCVETEETVSNPEINADFNSDGAVNSDDLTILINSFGSKGESTADLNNDDVVDDADLALFQTKWTE